jgi:predicted molibdopterin-dependent oxidoreductase YjgC
LESALFGTKFAEDFFSIHTGGDIPFLNGTIKHTIANGWVDETFIQHYTTGKATLEAQSWEELERLSGSKREGNPKNLRSKLSGRDACLCQNGCTSPSGLMPIRGRSGVQGGALVGMLRHSFSRSQTNYFCRRGFS